MPDFASFAERLGHSFRDPDLLVEALTHSSYLNEHPHYGGKHNERLEFLGDAVLDLVVTDFLFRKYPAKPEGDLTVYRAALVNTVSNAAHAKALGVNDFILLSKGEWKNTGRGRDVILANAFEAIIGAIYLDAGYAAAEKFIGAQVYEKIHDVLAERSYQNAKSILQERSQEKEGITPTYDTLSIVGPVHDRDFTVGVFIGEREIARGAGKSKQEAEQAAAQAALDVMSGKE
jgi:ribonuclease-3